LGFGLGFGVSLLGGCACADPTSQDACRIILRSGVCHLAVAILTKPAQTSLRDGAELFVIKRTWKPIFDCNAAATAKNKIWNSNRRPRIRLQRHFSPTFSQTSIRIYRSSQDYSHPAGRSPPPGLLPTESYAGRQPGAPLLLPAPRLALTRQASRRYGGDTHKPTQAALIGS
jgi:hypothetical protein